MYLSQTNFEELSPEKVNNILFSENYEVPHKCDYVILLGTIPKYAVERAKIAASFYKKVGGIKIITTGGAVSDKTVDESTVMRNELLSCGVASEDIIEEPNARDTIQNMLYSAIEISKGQYIPDVRMVTVITEPYHMKRSLLLAKAFLPKYFEIFGYTEGAVSERDSWVNDARLHQSVKNEIDLLCHLIDKKVIEDIAV